MIKGDVKLEHAKSSRRIRKIALVCLSIMVFIPIMSACGMFAGGKKVEENRVLRIGVMYGDSYSSDGIRTEYTDLFEFDKDYLDIEVVSAVDWSTRRYSHYNSDSMEQEPDPREEMKKLLEGPNPPDIIFLDSYDDYAYFANENLLTSLEPLIQKDDFDTDGFVPLVVEGLKSVSNNTLYGLAPRFSSTALIYNKNMFDQYNVPYPEDNMTWDDIFDLARRFPNGTDENKTFGFSFRNYNYADIFEDINAYVGSLELQMFASDGESMLIDSDAWRAPISKIVSLYEEGVLPKQSDMYIDRGPDWRPSPFDYDLFLGGRVAMSIIHYSSLREVVNANESAHAIENFDGVEWDVVTVPVHPDNPDVGGQMSLYPIMAINANGANHADAWELIKFVNSKEWAELKSRASYQLMSRKDFIKPLNGLDYNIAAFYSLKPPMPNQDDRRLEREVRYLWDVKYIGRYKLEQVLSGDMSVDQAIKEWQTEGDAMLKQLKENPGQSPHMMQETMIKRAAGF